MTDPHSNSDSTMWRTETIDLDRAISDLLRQEQLQYVNDGEMVVEASEYDDTSYTDDEDLLDNNDQEEIAFLGDVTENTHRGDDRTIDDNPDNAEEKEEEYVQRLRDQRPTKEAEGTSTVLGSALLTTAALRFLRRNDDELFDQNDARAGASFRGGKGNSGGTAGGAVGGGIAAAASPPPLPANTTAVLQQMAVSATQTAASGVATGMTTAMVTPTAASAGFFADPVSMAMTAAATSVAVGAAAVAASVVVANNNNSTTSVCPGLDTLPGRMTIDFIGVGTTLFPNEALTAATAFEQKYNELFGCASQYGRTMVNCTIPCDEGEQCCESFLDVEFGDVTRCLFDCFVECTGCPPSEPLFSTLPPNNNESESLLPQGRVQGFGDCSPQCILTEFMEPKLCREVLDLPSTCQVVRSWVLDTSVPESELLVAAEYVVEPPTQSPSALIEPSEEGQSPAPLLSPSTREPPSPAPILPQATISPNLAPTPQVTTERPSADREQFQFSQSPTAITPPLASSAELSPSVLDSVINVLLPGLIGETSTTVSGPTDLPVDMPTEEPPSPSTPASTPAREPPDLTSLVTSVLSILSNATATNPQNSLPTIGPSPIPELPTVGPSPIPTSAPPTVAPSPGPTSTPSTVEPSTVAPSMSVTDEVPILDSETLVSLVEALLSGMSGNEPTRPPTVAPTTTEPTSSPITIIEPSLGPTTIAPTESPTVEPSKVSTSEPTASPTVEPSDVPTVEPTESPTPQPTPPELDTTTIFPTVLPTITPTLCPTRNPTLEPTEVPTDVPSTQPSSSPTRNPSAVPTTTPSLAPITMAPTRTPTNFPSFLPTPMAVSPVTKRPTPNPTLVPTGNPSKCPTAEPSQRPSPIPSGIPSSGPSTFPSSSPTDVSSGVPSKIPTQDPSASPSSEPSAGPTDVPFATESQSPSGEPTSNPTQTESEGPSAGPSQIPTEMPLEQPSSAPSQMPSRIPSEQPISETSAVPSQIPSWSPSEPPSQTPTQIPSPSSSEEPSMSPSEESESPSTKPSQSPSKTTSESPSVNPTRQPTSTPSAAPTQLPSGTPMATASEAPSKDPSTTPTVSPTTGAPVAPTNLIVNGSFEDGVTVSGGSSSEESDSNIPGWTALQASTINIVGDGYVDGPSSVPAGEGDQFVQLDFNPQMFDGISQDVVTQPGTVYELKFRIRVSLASTQSTLNPVVVEWGGVQYPSSSGYAPDANGDWTEVVVQVTGGSGGTDTLVFREPTILQGFFPISDGRGQFLDDVRLTAT